MALFAYLVYGKRRSVGDSFVALRTRSRRSPLGEQVPQRRGRFPGQFGLWISLTLLATVAVSSPQARPGQTVTVIAYGDIRFTDPTNAIASNPHARMALIERIAEERPNAVLLSGDVPWRGGWVSDYEQFHAETEVWRSHRLRVFPALGNHEFAQCEPKVCLEHWWAAFPERRGQRWYAADLDPKVQVVTLDTMSKLTAGSRQRMWLEHHLATLPPTLEFVILTLHHPPVADVQTRVHLDHNPRPNERDLAAYLAGIAPSSRAQFVVVAGHFHNYERFLQDGVVYLVAGGGGAAPYEIDRTPDDLYQALDFPNYHYVKLVIADGVLTGHMYRLDEPDALPPRFTLKDTFTLTRRGQGSASSAPPNVRTRSHQNTPTTD